jgi:hypothetical protein
LGKQDRKPGFLGEKLEETKKRIASGKSQREVAVSVGTKERILRRRQNSIYRNAVFYS